jgi:hypothetical protein
MSGIPDRPSAAFGDCSNDAKDNLARERSQTSFNVRELTHFFNGSPRVTACKELVMRQLETFPEFSNAGDPDLTKAELRRVTVQRIRNIYRLFMSDGGDMDMRQARIEVTSLYSPDWSTRNGVHFGLFLSAITSQGTREQQVRSGWRRADSRSIVSAHLTGPCRTSGCRPAWRSPSSAALR